MRCCEVDREAMLDRSHPALSIRRQCTLLHLARSGVYRAKAANDDEDVALLRRLDELFTQYPFMGSRRLRLELREEAFGSTASGCSG